MTEAKCKAIADNLSGMAMNRQVEADDTDPLYEYNDQITGYIFGALKEAGSADNRANNIEELQYRGVSDLLARPIFVENAHRLVTGI